MKTYVALLRGINVGGSKPVPMPALRGQFVELGFPRAETYVQSGNVVFESKGAVGPKQIASLERRLAEAFGAQIPVIVRAQQKLKEVLENNPFPGVEADPTKLLIVFLEEAPGVAAVAKLDPKRSPTDRFAVDGQEIYLSCPNGYGRSKLTADYFERVLRVRATARNWRTVQTLAEWELGKGAK